MNHEINRIDESIRRILDELNIYEEQIRYSQNRLNYPPQNHLHYPMYSHYPSYPLYPSYPYYNPMYIHNSSSRFNNSTSTSTSTSSPHSVFQSNHPFQPTPPDPILRRQTRNNAVRNRRTRGVLDSLMRNINSTMPRNVDSIEISISDLSGANGQQMFGNLLNTNRCISMKNLIEGTDIYINTNLGENCSICQDVILDQQIVRKINRCGHCFHIRCLERWLQENNKCPHCRTVVEPIPESEITNRENEETLTNSNLQTSER